MPRALLKKIPPGKPRLVAGIVGAVAAVLVLDAIRQELVGLYDEYTHPHKPPPAPPSIMFEPSAASATAAPAPTQRPATPDEIALVRPIVPGSMLDDYKVEAIHMTNTGALRLDVVNGEVRFSLDVAFIGPKSPFAPVRAERYGIYFQGAGRRGADGLRLAEALGKIVTANAPVVPAPAEMQPLPAQGQ